jgi:uncharacterized repeat protein (TIGR01451 family)
MAGKKRFALKWLVLALVLAAGGAGVHYHTSGGGLPWSWLRTMLGRTIPPVALRAEENSATSAANLDAVAGAWADSVSPRTIGSQVKGASSESSPMARSADAAFSQAASPTEITPSRYDRYAEPLSPTPTNVTAAAATDTTDAPATEPATDPAYSRQPPPAAAVITVQASPEAEPITVARGQDPEVNPAAAAEPTGPSGSSAYDTSTADLRLPDDLPATASGASAAERARQAFSEQPAVATTSDRYRTATEARQGDAGNNSRGAPLINPFALEPNQSPAAASAAAGNSSVNSTTGGPAGAAPAGASPTATSPATPRTARSAESAAPPFGYDRAAETTRPASAFDSPAANQYNRGPARTASAQGDPITGVISPTDAAGMQGTGRPGERALEGAQNPSLVIQKLAPPEIQVGKPAKFVIQVRNAGSQAAADVVIRDEVPQGTRLLSTSPTAEANGSELLWHFGNLSIGEERSIEMHLMPTSEGEVGSVATVTYSAQASIKTRSTMPQLAIRMTAPKQVMIGQEQRVKIEIRNPGSGDATGVMLFENVPENVRHAAGPALEFEIGTLRAGETRELELVLLAEKPGEVVNVLTARAEGNLEVQQQVEFEVIAPKLTVAVNGPERRYLERPATYEVKVANPGTAPARDVQLVTKLPKGMKFIRANNMGEYDAGTHAVYWSLAELPEGEQGTVEVVAMPIEAGTQTLQVEGRAQQGLADETKQQVVVEGLAAIMFELHDLEDPIEVGRETNYEIRVVNQGTKAATNVQVAVTLPQGMQVVNAEGETRPSIQQGVVLFSPLRELAAKSDTVYRLKVQCLRPGDQRVTVEVKTDDLSQPIRREESTRVFGDD